MPRGRQVKSLRKRVEIYFVTLAVREILQDPSFQKTTNRAALVNELHQGAGCLVVRSDPTVV